MKTIVTRPKAGPSISPSSLQHRAYGLLRSPFLFNEFLAAIRSAGLIGERNNALVLFIVAVSRLLSRPLSTFVKGLSSSGKNWLVRLVLLFLPRGRVRELTSASKTAFQYAQNHFRHRVLFLQEKDDSPGTVHPLRLLLSEGKLIRDVTTWVDGKRVAKRYVARGPVAAISTTTKSALQIDDENRHFSLFTNDSAKQTRRILLAYGNEQELHEGTLKVWHEVQRLLESRARTVKIVFPSWFQSVAANVSVDDVSIRRHYFAFVEACRTVCLVRSFQRFSPNAAVESIEVEFADFAITAILLEKVLAATLKTRYGDAEETRRRVARICSRTSGAPIQAEDLAREMKIPLQTAYKRLREAREAGAVRLAKGSPEKNNKKLYLPGPSFRFLPDPELLFQKTNSAGRIVRFVHPLTGEWVTFRRSRPKS